MRIALLTDGVWPYVLGGMQKHSYYLAKYLSQQHIDVDLYHFNQSNYDINKQEFFSDDEKSYITNIVLDFPMVTQLPGHYVLESYLYSREIFKKISNRL